MRNIFIFIQKLLVNISLVLTYIILFGLVFLFVVTFKRRLFRILYGKDSFWEEPVGYNPNIDDCLRQS